MDLLVQDYSDLTWEIARNRQLKVTVIAAARRAAIAKVFFDPPGDEELNQFFPEGAGSSEGASKALEDALVRRGKTFPEFVRIERAIAGDLIEDIDRDIGRLERRRARILKEFKAEKAAWVAQREAEHALLLAEEVA